MKQRIALITLGVMDLDRSMRFYKEGFGWNSIFEDNETVFYQMNGFVLSTWLQSALNEDMQRSNLTRLAAFTLAHNVSSAGEVQELLNKLSAVGGHILRNADAPKHGGVRGYIADPDEHTWEIIWNPIWGIDDQDSVIFKPKLSSDI